MIGLGLRRRSCFHLLVITGLTRLVAELDAARRDTARALVLPAIQALPPERVVWARRCWPSSTTYIARAPAGALHWGAYGRS